MPEMMNTLKAQGGENSSATNAKAHYQIVSQILDQALQELNEFKTEVEDVKTDMAQMKQRIGNQHQEIKNILTPVMDTLYRGLKQQITAQKDENSKLQNQITELKKEKSQIQQCIIQSVQKISYIENNVGNY